MTRAVVFLAAAMVAASLGLLAQDSSGAPNAAQQRNTLQPNITVAGCLNRSDSGGFTLSDERGNNYALSGDTDNLRSHASQQIEITGQQQLATGASSGTSSTSTIQITNTKVIADHCGAQSNQRANDPDASAVASVDDALNNGQLPQTSTILPLLGLIGLGSLVAGFFARR